jgi:hypothetical protein
LYFVSCPNKVPLLPSSAYRRQPPLVFIRNSAAETDFVNVLQVPLADSTVLKKINVPGVKRAKVALPEIGVDTKAKPKSKAKAKATPKAEKANKKDVDNGMISEEVAMTGSASRRTVWVDDLIKCLQHVQPHFNAEATAKVLSFLISLGLEFAFLKCVSIGGKQIKLWSQARCC